MARNTRRPSWRNVKPSQVLPVWTTNHSNATNLVAGELLARFGVTGMRSYFTQMSVAIIISVVVCAIYGSSTSYGINGFFIGGLAGLFVPVTFVWFATLLVGIVLNLAIFCAVWAVIIYTIFWILGG